MTGNTLWSNFFAAGLCLGLGVGSLSGGHSRAAAVQFTCAAINAVWIAYRTWAAR